LGTAAVLLVRLSPSEGLAVGLSLWLSMGWRPCSAPFSR